MSETTTAATAPPESAAAHPRRVKLGIAGALAGMFLGMMDSYIVATALPSIVDDLGGFRSMTWIITSYALAIAAVTQVWGKLSDLYDRKTVFLVSVAVFLAGSMLCGLAQNMGELIAFRALQGVGAGGLLVGAMAMVQALLPPKESTRISSWTGLLLGVALIAGPLVGGVLTSSLSWRWIFYVNVPFGLLCLLGTVIGVNVPTRPKSTRVSIDYLGTALLTAAVVSLTLVTAWAGPKYAWSSPLILGLIAVVVVATFAFVHVERRATEPLVPFRMFGTRNFSLAQVLGFGFNVTMVASVNFLPQYFQNARGVDPIRSGFLLVPMMAGMVVVMNRGSAYIRRTGRYRILPIIGGAGVVVGMLLVLLLGPDTDPMLASLVGIPLGVGLGCLIQNTILIIRMSVEPRDIGAAMGLGSLTRTMGSGIGAALFGTLYLGALTSTLTDKLGSAELLSSGRTRLAEDNLHSMAPAVQAAWSAAVTHGLHVVAVGTAVAGAGALLAACFIREVELVDNRRSGPRR
ncbi:MDR family MFS transporter [Paractinoplanes ferrugineus]|uniref:MFS transporter n=1 Tax=Paractinoplanes ferrugineus TaxID=113564 RepID=A0A919J8N4_9ACTN|nr:MFS transporter [Actinoplanes ferrugineus]GIE15327.1 MFS transporter [Actinoplanes ferrugineus]